MSHLPATFRKMKCLIQNAIDEDFLGFNVSWMQSDEVHAMNIYGDLYAEAVLRYSTVQKEVLK